MAAPDFLPLNMQLEQLPQDHLKSVEIEAAKFYQLSRMVLQSAEVSLDDFEQHFDAIFPENSNTDDPERGYKATAAFEQLQADGVIALQPSTKSDNYEVKKYKAPQKPLSTREANKQFYGVSRKARKTVSTEDRKSGDFALPMLRTIVGNRKAAKLEKTSYVMGKTLHDATVPAEEDSRLKTATKSVVRTWGQDSISAHKRYLDDVDKRHRKRYEWMTKQNAPIEIDPAVAEWARERETVVRFVGSTAAEVDPGNSLSLTEMRGALFTEPSVATDIRRAYDEFTSRVKGSGMSPDDAMTLREQVIHDQAAQTVWELAAGRTVPDNFVEIYASLVATQYVSPLGQNTIRDYEELKKQLSTS